MRKLFSIKAFHDTSSQNSLIFKVEYHKQPHSGFHYSIEKGKKR
jgi:hypothetical protein